MLFVAHAGHICLEERPPSSASVPPSPSLLRSCEAQHVTLESGNQGEESGPTSSDCDGDVSCAWDLTWERMTDADGLPLYSSYHIWGRPAAQQLVATSQGARGTEGGREGMTASGAAAGCEDSGSETAEAETRNILAGPVGAPGTRPATSAWVWLGQCFTERFYVQLLKMTQGSGTWELAIQPVNCSSGLPACAVDASTRLVVGA